VRPDFSTLVDVTFPTLMLDDPRGGESYAGGQVHYIKWTARDEHFGSLPITIYIARDGGQWELMAADLPNNGTYGWNVPRVDYASYRMKIEARDQVGNTTTVVSDNFSVVSAPPESRIRAVIPAMPLVGVAEVPTPGGEKPEAPEKKEPEPVKETEATPPPTGKSEGDVRDLIDRATGMRLRGDYEGAEAALKDAISIDPKNVAARNELGALLIQQGRYDQAIGILEAARVADPKDADVLYNLAGAHYALGQYREAAQAFETIVMLDSSNEAALWNLAKARYAAKDATGARQAWQQIVTMDLPGSPFVERARKALAAVPEPPTK